MQHAINKHVPHAAFDPQNALDLFVISDAPFTFFFLLSFAQVASSQRGLGIQTSPGLAEPRHVTVRLSAPVGMLAAPQIRSEGGGKRKWWSMVGEGVCVCVYILKIFLTFHYFGNRVV